MGSDPALLARLCAATLRPWGRRAREHHGGDGGHPDGHARSGPRGPQRQAAAPAPGPPGGCPRLREPGRAWRNARRSAASPSRRPSMNAATRRAATVALVVLLLANPVQAWVDPVEAGLLARIAAVMQAIEQFRIRVMATIHEQIYVRINAYAFPRPLLDPINVAITEVSDVRRELQRMACDWPMSFRTRSLSDLFWEKTQFCRGNYQAVWGSHEGFWDGPLQEVNDYFATMTGNMISERSEKTNTSWVQAHK